MMQDRATSSASPLVYVIDDDRSICRSLGRLLRSLGLRSREFASGPELFADERCSEADCLLVDIHMPEMSGYELVALLADSGLSLPVVFITAQAEELDRWQDESSPAIALLLKPFSEEELIAALELALGRDRMLGGPA